MMPILDRLFSLQDTTGIVTGGAEGLGLAIAARLAEAGARGPAFSRTGRTQRSFFLLNPGASYHRP